MGKFLDSTGLSTLWENVKTLTATKLDKTQYATDSTYGIVKINSADQITLDSDGHLVIQGRYKASSTGGISFAGTPSSIGANSVLVTEANGTGLGSKSLSVSTGFGLTVQSAPAGSTSYTVSNTYENRIICALAIGGVATLNEDSASTTSKILSVTVGGAQVAPSSTNSSTPIVIMTESSVNPDSDTTSIRIYPNQIGFSNLFIGVAGSNATHGYSVIAGQKVYNGSNASAVFGNAQYNTANSSLLAGRQHINSKQNAFLAGQGHDTTYGSPGVSAVGQWSSITSSTLFAVGNGTSNIARSNALEVTSEGLVIKSPDGTKWIVEVTNAGVVTAVRAS